MKRSINISFLALVIAISLAFGGCSALGKSTNKNEGFTLFDSGYTEMGSNTIDMESSIDSFTLSDVSYGANDKFVFTGTVSFER